MKKIIPLIMVLFFLAGCTDRRSDILSKTDATAYPIPFNTSIENGYPITSNANGLAEGEKPNFNEPRIIDTPTPGNGNVIGTLKLKGLPAKNINLFLAGFVQDNLGKDAVAFVSPGKSPETVTDEHGNFIFNNVPIGNYGVVLEYISDTYILLTPDGSTTLMALVVDQQTTDLGILDYDTLPIK